MAGRAASNALTRYSGIQVQTSALALQVPVGWGTFRCKCNLLDYLDFKSKAQKASSGKGGSTTTGYSYSATIIMGLCEGPIDSITTVYVDSTTYVFGSSSGSSNTGSTSAMTQAGLTLATGAVGQPVWSYLTSNHPTHAIGYSGITIAYAENYPLDTGASPPNHSFEVVRTTGFGVSGTPDADPSLVLKDFFTNTRTGVPIWNGPSNSQAFGLALLSAPAMTQYQNYCLAAGLLVSPVIDQERSASDFLNEMLLATNSTCVWSEGMLKMIPYGDTALTGNGKTYTPNITPVYALNDDSYIVDKDVAPLMVDILDQSDAYNFVQFEFLDRTNQYNMAIAPAGDAANVAQFGERRKDPDTVHVIATPSVAAQAAQLWLQRTLYTRCQYKFTLGWMYAILEPGDIVEVTDTVMGLVNYPVRIIQIDEDEKYGLAIIAEDAQIGTATAPTYTMQQSGAVTPNHSVDPGGVEANLLLWAGDQTNAVWSKQDITVVGAAATDQYGLTTACAIVPDTSNVVHRMYQGVTSFAGSNYTLSVCLQKSAHYKARVFLCDASTVDGVYMDVDLNAGTIITQPTILGNATVGVGSMNATLVSGIWQIVLTTNTPSATTLYMVIDALSDSGSDTWAGDSSHAILMSQAQIRQGVVPGVYAQTTTAAAGPYIFNPPSVLSPTPATWAAVSGGANWGGCYVWTSVDGTTYQQVGTIDGSGRFGFATTSFPSHADPDTVDALGVDLSASGGSLTGGAQSAADSGGTLCLIDQELICYESATVTNPCRYTLGTYIRRGYLGTTIAAHTIGAPFVRIDDGVFDFPYLAPNAGQQIYVKFQSFNKYGNAVQQLANCIAYSFIPYPVSAAAPGSGAWTAIGTTLSNNGQSTPVIVITGASDNPSATAIEFDYRVTGTTAWVSSGTASNQATTRQISSVQPSQLYDVSVLYIVNGIPSNREIIATGISTGAVATGASAGVTLLSDNVPGVGKTYTLPAGSYAHVDIILTGIGGSGSLYAGTKGGTVPYGGSGGSTAVYLTLAVTPGTTSFTYTLPSAVGTAATLTSPAMSAPSGINATPSGAAAAPAAATGGTHNYAGHAGGLTDTWDGGGAATSTGTYTDQTTTAQPGLTPGGGGAGESYNTTTGVWTPAPGAGASIQIIART